MTNIKYINSENLFSNLTVFSKKKICAMVKSNAYGHGICELVKLIDDRVDCYGVVNTDEGKKVRTLSDKPILVCSKISNWKMCRKYNLEVMVDDENDLRNCLKYGLKDCCHLKLNSGMNRFGVKSDFCIKILNEFIEENDFKLKSIYTHFHDTQNLKKTFEDYQRFLKLRVEITQNPPICFGGSNMIDYPFEYDMLRLGIGMYGYGHKSLLPVMNIISYVSKVYYANAGEFIGYGKKYKVKFDSFFAVVPVGYGDGLRRNLSGKFKVKINGKRYSCVGNICMDAFFVKVDESVKVGDEVFVIEDAEYVSRKLGTISYEVLTGFSNFRGKTIIL